MDYMDYKTELQRTATMLFRQHLDLSRLVEEQQKQISEMDKISKRFVQQDIELLETKDLLRQIDQTRSKNEVLLASIDEGIIIIDRYQTIEMANYRAEKILGYSNKAIIGKKLAEVVQLEDERGTAVETPKQTSLAILANGERVATLQYFFHASKKKTDILSATLTTYLLYDRIAGAIITLRPIIRQWGVVFDDKTKKPLPLAVVRLFSMPDKKLRETKITDNLGRYSFITKPGQYVLDVARQSYQFPTKGEAGYKGELIKIGISGGIIVEDIPLEPD